MDSVIASEDTPFTLVNRPLPTWRLVLTLAWPVLIQQLLLLTVLLSDQFLAGRFVQIPPDEQAEALRYQVSALGQLGGNGLGGVPGALGAAAPLATAHRIVGRQVAYLSAQTTAIYITWIVGSYLVLVSVGGTALVSRCVGAGAWDEARYAANQSLVLAVGVGVVGTAVGLSILEAVIPRLGLHGPAARHAVEYLQPLFYLLVFQAVEQAGVACLVGAGDTRTGLWILGGVAIVNLPLAWFLLHGLGPLPALGFAGIAWGTAVSHLLGCLAVLITLAHGRAGLVLQADRLRPHFHWLRRLLRISLPAGIDSLSVAVGHLWFLSIVNELGDVASTAHGIALRWEGLGYLSGGAFGTAAATLVGQNLGARRPDQAAHSGWTAFALGCGVMCFMGVVFFALAPEMFALFCPRPEQRPVIEIGVPVLRLVAFAMPPLACCIVFTSALRGAGDTRVPMLFTWIGFLGVRIPLAYLLTRSELDLGSLGTYPGPDFGLLGAWLAMVADLVVRGAFFLYRFARGRWQLVRV
jgi:MATE family, multidrug efflux pump